MMAAPVLVTVNTLCLFLQTFPYSRINLRTVAYFQSISERIFPFFQVLIISLSNNFRSYNYTARRIVLCKLSFLRHYTSRFSEISHAQNLTAGSIKKGRVVAQFLHRVFANGKSKKQLSDYAAEGFFGFLPVPGHFGFVG